MNPVDEDKLHTYRETDCAGPGLDVTIETVQNEKKYLFDNAGHPCNPSTVVYDGNVPNAQRPQPLDPNVGITFHDKLGPLHDDRLAPAPVIKVTTSGGLIPVSGTAVQPAKREDDNLMKTLNAWQGERKTMLQKHAEHEKLAADEAARQIARVGQAQNSVEQQKQVNMLLGQLRETERKLQFEQKNNQATIEEQAAQTDVAQSAIRRFQTDQEDLKSQLAATQARLAEVENVSQQLAANNARQRDDYQKQLVAMSSDIKSAEAKADQSRQQLIFAAAKKVAEADELARAASLSAADSKAREAARLKAEADASLDAALDLTADGRPRGLPNPAKAPLALADVPVVVHQKDQPLDVIVAAILAQAESQSGKWTADWQLSKDAQYILKEKWSLTAEAPVRALLQNLTTQVKTTHNLNLKFTQFGQSRLLVITDE
jgi:DNA repair exonuclease SbcCD ATPase subunit